MVKDTAKIADEKQLAIDNLENLATVDTYGRSLAGLKTFLTVEHHRHTLAYILKNSPVVMDITKHLKQTKSNTWHQALTSQLVADYQKAGLIEKEKFGRFKKIVPSNRLILLLNILN